MKQPLLFLSFNYTSARRLDIVYIKQPLLSNLCFIVQLSSARRLAIVYIKQPLLVLWFNYPQRAV